MASNRQNATVDELFCNASWDTTAEDSFVRKLKIASTSTNWHNVVTVDRILCRIAQEMSVELRRHVNLNLLREKFKELQDRYIIFKRLTVWPGVNYCPRTNIMNVPIEYRDELLEYGNSVERYWHTGERCCSDLQVIFHGLAATSPIYEPWRLFHDHVILSDNDSENNHQTGGSSKPRRKESRQVGHSTPQVVDVIDVSSPSSVPDESSRNGPTDPWEIARIRSAHQEHNEQGSSNNNVSVCLMAAFKLFVFTLLLSIVFAGIGADADASISDVDAELKSDGSDPAILEQLKFQIESLEHHVEEKTREIKDKDAVIAAKEKIIKEKSDSIMSLESEVTSLQKKGKSVAAEQVGKAHARAGELEKQVQKLEKDVDAKIKEKEQLEARVTEAEKKAAELNSKVANLVVLDCRSFNPACCSVIRQMFCVYLLISLLQKKIDDQKTKIRKTERALQIAEEEMMKAKYEATSKTKELMEAHGAWFPPWLAVHFSHYQSHLERNWKVHGKPALETLIQKAIKKKAQAEEWVAPHVETMKTKWVPAVKEQWVVLSSNVEPHVQTLTTKTIEIYETSKNAVTPHIIKVVEIVDPYYQEVRKISKPYIDQVVTATRPHVDTLHTALKPYTKKAVLAYGKFLESATVYHHRVQDKVQEKLKSHELTKPLATKELIWFAASALLALPIIFLMKICSAVFCKKTQKPIRNGNHSRRKAKRGHQDK
ncbi:hypothetical protein BUALT_Bualt05G0029600 [Buddleja alternifolia]|uniref:Uncharacterized protein n=1 Tax=Buddleja alternifolia TaxID=168488 RepID=A0AAV6XN03_9LAMI|nr:hypothetical protein BUALT_Bualt05G0029600 [Buddleja alternifolia]